MKNILTLFGCYLSQSLWKYVLSFFSTLGFIWLIIESYIGIERSNIDLSYWTFLKIALIIGTIWFLIDGFFIAGFLKSKISFQLGKSDTLVEVKYGDIFKQDGWKAIGVNDFFDSIVDDKHIAKNSLHGSLLSKFWGGNISDWDIQVSGNLSAISSTTVNRQSGKLEKYPIGTTVYVEQENNKFLCVALTTTDVSTLQTKADSKDLIVSVKGVLHKARTVCANNPLNFPIMGSGLSRLGIHPSILIDLMFTAILEETKVNKVTSKIRIILPVNMCRDINLAQIEKDWK